MVADLVPLDSFLVHEVEWKTETQPGLERDFLSFTLSTFLLPVSPMLGFYFQCLFL